MALVNHASGVKLLLKVGDGMSPETFAQYCTINAARGFTIEAATNDFIIPDCDDLDGLAWLAREKVSLSMTVNGAGILNTDDTEDFYDWLVLETPKNVQIVVDVPSGDGGVIFAGAFHLTSFTLSGDRGAKITAELTLVSDGEVTVTANT